MQINYIRHNLIFHVPLLPQGHNHSLWGPGSLLSPCTRAAPSCPVLLSITRKDEEQRGTQGRAPSWVRRQQNRGTKVWFAAPWLGHLRCKRSQALVTLLLYLMIQLQLRACIIPPAPALPETFPISFGDENIWREAKKDPQWSELKDTGKLAPENSYHGCPCSIPSAVRGCTLPAVSPWRALRQTHARGRESRSENSRHLAGGRCDKSLAEHKTKSNFKISNRHLTALKRASSAFVCLHNALRGWMRELGSIDVMGTYCSAGRYRANLKALSLIQTLYITGFPSS